MDCNTISPAFADRSEGVVRGLAAVAVCWEETPKPSPRRPAPISTHENRSARPLSGAFSKNTTPNVLKKSLPILTKWGFFQIQVLQFNEKNAKLSPKNQFAVSTSKKSYRRHHRKKFTPVIVSQIQHFVVKHMEFDVN